MARSAATAVAALACWCRPGRRLAEQQQGRGGGDLENGNRLARVGLFAAIERPRETLVIDQRAGETDALVEAHQVGRGVAVDAFSGRLERGAHEGDGRALAVGSRDMHDGRQALVRRAEVGEQTLDAAERKIDPPGMQRRETRGDCIGLVHQGPPEPAMGCAAPLPAGDAQTGS